MIETRMPGVADMQSPTNDSQMPMASPEQRQQLFDMIEATRGKLGELNTAHFSQQNTSEANRLGALKEMFSMLEQAGVNLQDPQSVAAFLAQISELNPELSQLFESAFDSLLGGEGEMLDVNMQNNNETIPEELRGSVPDGGEQASEANPLG